MADDKSVHVQANDEGEAATPAEGDITADQDRRLSYLFNTTATWSILGFRDAISEARREGTTMPKTGERIIQQGEHFSRAAITSFLDSYGQRAERFGFKNRREGFGLKKGQKRPAQPRAIKRESSIWVPAPRVQYQMDLADYDRYMKFTSDGEYDTDVDKTVPRIGLRWALGVIDVNSRYAMVVPLRNREQHEGSDLRNAFLHIMSVMGTPERLNADREFQHTWWREWAEKNDVALQLSDPDNAINNKNAIIESFWKVFTKIIVKFEYMRKPWGQIVPKLLNAYNTKKHFTTHERPIDIWKGKVANRQTIQVAKPSPSSRRATLCGYA